MHVLACSGVPHLQLVHCSLRLTDLALGDLADEVKRESAHALAVMSRTCPMVVTETVLPFILKKMGSGSGQFSVVVICCCVVMGWAECLRHPVMVVTWSVYCEFSVFVHSTPPAPPAPPVLFPRCR